MVRTCLNPNGALQLACQEFVKQVNIFYKSQLFGEPFQKKLPCKTYIKCSRMMKTAANIARFSLRFLPFTMLLHFSLKKIWAKFAFETTKKCWPKCLLLHCIQHQNALHLAPKRKAFSTKMQGIQHQNARQNAPKRKAKCTKTQIKGIKSGLRRAIYRQIAPYRRKAAWWLLADH